MAKSKENLRGRCSEIPTIQTIRKTTGLCGLKMGHTCPADSVGASVRRGPRHRARQEPGAPHGSPHWSPDPMQKIRYQVTAARPPLQSRLLSTRTWPRMDVILVEQKTREPKVAMQLEITSQLKLWMIR